MLRTPFVHTDFFPPCSPAFLKTIRPVRVAHVLASSSSCRPSSAMSSACSLIGSPLCDFTLIRNVALPAVIRILNEHTTSRMMSAFGAVASVALPPSPIHLFTSVRTDSLSQRYRMSSVPSTCRRAASSAQHNEALEANPDSEARMGPCCPAQARYIHGVLPCLHRSSDRHGSMFVLLPCCPHLILPCLTASSPPSRCKLTSRTTSAAPSLPPLLLFTTTYAINSHQTSAFR